MAVAGSRRLDGHAAAGKRANAGGLWGGVEPVPGHRRRSFGGAIFCTLHGDVWIANRAVNIQGSVDNVTFFNIPYALVATPATFVIAAITVTTAVTTVYLLQRDQPWRYVNAAYSANTNVTLTATAVSR